jgi:flagellar biosynthesis/type III secretory pathway M-ring protein FliF/YscJ
MSTGTIIAIIVAAFVVIAIIMLASRAARHRKLDAQREQAGELRQTARERDRRAERESAIADEQAARAKQAEAEAEEKAAIARREGAEAAERKEAAQHEQALADDHHRAANDLDPDAGRDGSGDRETATSRDR